VYQLQVNVPQALIILSHILWLEQGYFDIACIFAALVDMILYPAK
jgi:hypothetical protein